MAGATGYIRSLNFSRPTYYRNAIIPWNKIIRKKFITQGLVHPDMMICENEDIVRILLLEKY